MDSWRAMVYKVRRLASRRASTTPYNLILPDQPHRLPSSARHRSWRTTHVCIQRQTTYRCTIIILACIFFLLVTAVLCSGIPPTYDDIRAYERRLPQHHLAAALHNDSSARYLRFPGHLWGHGFNNILQETCVLFRFAPSQCMLTSHAHAHPSNHPRCASTD